MAEQNLVFNIYKEDGTSFNDIAIKSSTYTETVMSLDNNIEGYFYYPNNNLVFTYKEYITYKNVKYYLKIDEPPTIVRKGLVDDDSETAGMTKYTIKFFHPMVLLYNIPFTDVAVSSGESKYKSEDTTFSWIGTLTALVQKINKCLEGTMFTCQLQPNFVDNGAQSDVISFDNQMISDVLKTTYEKFKVPFVVDGYNIFFGTSSNEIYKGSETTPYIFKMGQGLGLKDNDRTPKNNTIITRIACYGSDSNIPNGYPKIAWTGNQTWNYTLNNDGSLPNSYPIIDSVINGVSTRVINHPFTRKYLMPTVYVDCVNKKVNPLATGYNPNIELVDYYDAVNDANHTYPNQINLSSPSYQKHQLEKIKPSIVGAKYNNQEIDILKTVSWINDDGTDATNIDDGYNSTTGKYNQGYFKVSFYPLGFDLYAMAAVTSAMSVNPTSGACNGCKFELGVDWDVVKTNFYYTKPDGTVVFDPTNIYSNHRDYTKFPDSTNQSISVILKKDTSTFGTLMPNIYQQPAIGDKFVFIGIDLPQYYITQAQTNLDESSKQYMLENNIAYFEYPFTFDEYFLTENQDILAQIKSNSILRFEYGGENIALSIKELTIQWGDKALPEYKITLTDDVSISLNQLGQVTEGLSQLGSQVASIQASYDINITDELNKRVSKIYDDTVNGKITFKNDISVGGVLKVNSLTSGKIPYNTINGLSDSPLYTDGTNVTSSVNVTAPTFIGELQGNAASATKLQTPRIIFGQTFDGTSDVTGASYHTFNGKAIFFGDANQSYIGRNEVGNSYIHSNGSFFISTGGTKAKVNIDALGNMGVGTFNPEYKLDVNGNMRVTSDLYADASVGTRNFASHTTGWRTDSNGNADFRNIYADELRVQAFTADISQALAGSDYLTKSVSKLSANFVVPSVNSSVRIIVDDIEGMPATQCFTNGDYIRFRAFNRTSGLTIANVWGTVVLDTTFGTNGYLNGTQAYTFTCKATTGAGLTVFKGSEVLDYGTSGSGLIARTTLDAMGSPYEQIATWKNDPSNGNNYTVHARLGNLNGIANCNGYGLYTDNGFFTGKVTVGDLTKTNHYLDFSNGALTVKGNIYLSSGYAAVSTLDMSSGISLAVNNIQVGGRNLLTDSKTFYNYNNLSFWQKSDETYNGLDVYYNTSQWFGLSQNFLVKSGKIYTFSAYVKGDSMADLNIYCEGIQGKNLGNITNWSRVFLTFTSDTDFTTNFRIENSVSNSKIYVCGYKLIEGNKGYEDWSPAPEDVDASINLKVSKDGVIGAINLTSEAATIQASKINLVGAVTFNSFNSDLQTSFNDKASSASVTSAQNTANAAQSSANTANSAIANIVSDNMLSANEKGGERDRWNVIASEKSGISAQATTYGISTELTNYNNAFQSLATYLNNGTTWTTGVPTWLADASLATDTAIVGSTYRTNWNNYFSTRQILLNAIYAKAKALADAAQTKANTAYDNAASAQTDATSALNRNNTMAVKLGYTDYNALASAAALGHTLIDGGMINTVLINATAVVTNGLTANCITANMISSGAVTADKIYSGAVTTDKLYAGAVTATTIAAGAVTTDKLYVGAVTADKIAANTITADQINVNNVSAAVANVISLNANRITTGTLAADRIAANSIAFGKLVGTDITALGNVTAGSFNIGSGKFVVDSGGNLTAVNATISGTLNGVSGTFNYLRGVGSSGSLVFGKYGMTFEDEDFSQQGTKNSRALRFYSGNIRCRGAFGTTCLNMARVHDTVIDYYVNGDLNSYVRFNLQSNGVGGYYIPLYPTSDTGYSSVYGNATLGDVYGFPVDLLIFDNSSNYQYEMLAGSTGKKVTVVNAHDGNITVYLAINGNLTWALYGGAVQQYVNIRELTNPLISTSVPGAGWLMISDYDNNWA